MLASQRHAVSNIIFFSRADIAQYLHAVQVTVHTAHCAQCPLHSARGPAPAPAPAPRLGQEEQRAGCRQRGYAQAPAHAAPCAGYPLPRHDGHVATVATVSSHDCHVVRHLLLREWETGGSVPVHSRSERWDSESAHRGPSGAGVSRGGAAGEAPAASESAAAAPPPLGRSGPCRRARARTTGPHGVCSGSAGPRGRSCAPGGTWRMHSCSPATRIGRPAAGDAGQNF